VLKNYFFVGILKINDENRKILIPDPDPLVRSMDPLIRIWIQDPDQPPDLDPDPEPLVIDITT